MDILKAQCLLAKVHKTEGCKRLLVVFSSGPDTDSDLMHTFWVIQIHFHDVEKQDAATMNK